MISISEIVREGILEIEFSKSSEKLKTYTIRDTKERNIISGKVLGKTIKTCLYVGQLKKGKYIFYMNNKMVASFIIV